MPAAPNFLTLTLSTQHLSASTRKVLNGPLAGWPVAGLRGASGYMIYCHDENAGIPPIPDDLWPILVAARRQGAEYILFDDDDLPREDLPVYFGNKPNGVAVRSLDEGDLFFCGTPSNPTMVCCVRRADADEGNRTLVVSLENKQYDTFSTTYV